MDDIKPKLDEDAQEVLTSLADSSKAADDDAELLYEATKVRPTNLDCLYLLPNPFRQLWFKSFVLIENTDNQGNFKFNSTYLQQRL